MAQKEALIKFVVKLRPSFLQFLQERANLHTDGNVSAWLRLAALKYDPDTFAKAAFLDDKGQFTLKRKAKWQSKKES